MSIESMKKRMIDELISHREGGYVNNKHDSGGPTNHGITERVARRHGYRGSMKNMPLYVAFDIYAKKYWDRLALNSIAEMSPSIAGELFDSGVNTGTGRAAEWLQRSLNVLNRRGKIYEDIKVDGDIGPATIGALVAYLKKRGSDGEVVLFRMLNSMQGAFYIHLAERREKDEEFVFGWFRTRVA